MRRLFRSRGTLRGRTVACSAIPVRLPARRFRQAGRRVRAVLCTTAWPCGWTWVCLFQTAFRLFDAA